MTVRRAEGGGSTTRKRYDTNTFWMLRGNYEERRAKLSAMEREYLEATVLDGEYNDFLSHRADYPDGEREHGRGKRLPYIGWFWRHVCFSSGRVSVGDCGQFVGFMENNKWDYPERELTPDEFAGLMAIIDAAMRLSEQGGELSRIVKETNDKLGEVWDYMQTIRVR